MNAPIKSPPRPVTPPMQRPTPAESPSLSERLAPGGARRTELGRSTAAWPQPTPNEALNADGLFFSQLLVAPVSEEPDQSGYGGSGFSLLPPSDGVPTQLIGELAARLPAQPDGPFNVTLLMPNLGKVQVNASKRDNQWSVELGFARRGVLKRVQPHQRACETALAEALGHDVELSFHEDLPA